MKSYFGFTYHAFLAYNQQENNTNNKKGRHENSQGNKRSENEQTRNYHNHNQQI